MLTKLVFIAAIATSVPSGLVDAVHLDHSMSELRKVKDIYSGVRDVQLPSGSAS